MPYKVGQVYYAFIKSQVSEFTVLEEGTRELKGMILIKWIEDDEEECIYPHEVDKYVDMAKEVIRFSQCVTLDDCLIKMRRGDVSIIKKGIHMGFKKELSHVG